MTVVVTVRPERKGKRRSRNGVITAFRGDVRVDGERLVITPSRGATLREIDAVGERVGERVDHLLTLHANIDDRLIVCGPTVEEVAAVRVLVVSRDGMSVWARYLCGSLAPTTTRVLIFPMVPSRAAEQLDLLAKKKRRRA